MKLLSIIVPVFLVEPYLKRCLQSLEDQDIPKNDYEIICVNDGSPDNSREIIINFQRLYNNVILIDQENKGVSVARNNGFSQAIGKYIMFIDADDYVEKNKLRLMLDEIIAKNAQVAIPGYTFLDYNGTVNGKKNIGLYEKRILTGIDAYYISRKKKLVDKKLAKGIIPDSSVGIIYNAHFLQNECLSYLPDVPINEDVEFLARMHCIAEQCIFLNHDFYIVAARQGSSSRSTGQKINKVLKGYKIAVNNLKNFQQEESLNISQKTFLNGPIVQFVMLIIYSALKTKSINILISTISSLKSSNLRKLQLKGCNTYHRLCGTAYNISPYFGALVLVSYWKLVNLYNSCFK